MPQPTKSDVHVDRPLTNMSVAFLQDQRDFVASRVFPMLPVAKQSDQFFVYDKKQWFRSDSQKRAPGTPSAGSGYTLSTDSYRADVWAVHKDVDDQTRANADVPINVDREAVDFVMQQQLIRKEKEWMAAYFTTGIWSSDFTPGTLWSAASSDPIKDVRAQKRVIFRQTGRMPNKLVVSPDVDDILKDHPTIVERIKYTQFADVDNQILARLLGLEEYLVANAIEDMEPESEGGVEDLQHLASKDALLVYAAPRPGIMTPSAGYTFAWTGLFGASEQGNRIKRFRMEELASDRVESEMAWDLKLVSPELGIFFNNAIA
jgi:hypothetical protein